MTPHDELLLLHAEAVEWNRTSPVWSEDNQCFDQAVHLQAFLLSFNPKYWQVTTEGGWNGEPAIGWHHVVLLVPKPGNPLPPMVFDPFKGRDPGPQVVRMYTGADFRKGWPYDCGCCTNHPLPAKPMSQSFLGRVWDGLVRFDVWMEGLGS